MKDNNAFGALSDEAKKTKSSESATAAASAGTAGNDQAPATTIPSEPTNEQDSSWTVQSSSKPRRLVPQFSLTRQDLGTDKSAAKPVAHHPTGHHGEMPKKKSKFPLLSASPYLHAIDFSLSQW
ncbi:MAG: hypothetical protein EOO38_05730 [Cytophagaceae bacterium]|nr:MAG: hypothetical protein EOO38_05730 [Cytophagaceae bacterium]